MHFTFFHKRARYLHDRSASASVLLKLERRGKRSLQSKGILLRLRKRVDAPQPRFKCEMRAEMLDRREFDWLAKRSLWVQPQMGILKPRKRSRNNGQIAGGGIMAGQFESAK